MMTNDGRLEGGKKDMWIYEGGGEKGGRVMEIERKTVNEREREREWRNSGEGGTTKSDKE